MAMPKMHQEIMRKLESIEAKLGGSAKEPQTVTKEQLMEIKGVGPETADKILELLNQ